MSVKLLSISVRWDWDQVIYCETLTAEYWMMFKGVDQSRIVANVYSRLEGKDCCTFLGRRVLLDKITVDEDFTFYNGFDDPVSIIIPTGLQIVDISSVPTQEGLTVQKRQTAT